MSGVSCALPASRGLLAVNGEVFGRAAWQPIIDVGTWNEVVRIASHRQSQWHSRQETVRYYWLRGLIRCGECGAPMYGNASAEDRSGDRYTCARTAGGCGRLSISADHVEAHIGRLLVGCLYEWERGTAMAKRDEDMRAHEAIFMERERMAELAAAYGAGQISMSEWKAARTPIEARLKDLRKVRATRPTVAIDQSEWGANAEQAWNDADPPRRNALAATFWEAVLIHRAAARGPAFDPSRVQLVPHAVDSPEPPPDDDGDEWWLTATLSDEPTTLGAAP